MNPTNETLALKEAVIMASLDAFAPLDSSTPLQPDEQRDCITDTLHALLQYPVTYRRRSFAFGNAIPDYCAEAARNILQLMLLGEAPNYCIYTVGELLSNSLDYLQTAKEMLYPNAEK